MIPTRVLPQVSHRNQNSATDSSRRQLPIRNQVIQPALADGEYPLVASVGAAIARYLREARPISDRRELFLGLNSPHTTLSQSSVYNIVATGLRRLGVTTAHLGPHSLRHACAGRLVSEGLSLKEIGDHLGHRGVSTTRVYAKVNLATLREVAAFDLGGLR
jgi:site-specific recombinase XerD